MLSSTIALRSLDFETWLPCSLFSDGNRTCRKLLIYYNLLAVSDANPFSSHSMKLYSHCKIMATEVGILWSANGTSGSGSNGHIVFSEANKEGDCMKSLHRSPSAFLQLTRTSNVLQTCWDEILSNHEIFSPGVAFFVSTATVFLDASVARCLIRPRCMSRQQHLTLKPLQSALNFAMPVSTHIRFQSSLWQRTLLIVVFLRLTITPR